MLLADKLVPPTPPPFSFSILLLRLLSPSVSLWQSGLRTAVERLPKSNFILITTIISPGIRKQIFSWVEAWKLSYCCNPTIYSDCCMERTHTHRRSHVVESVVNLSNRTEPICRNNFGEKRSSKSFTIFTFFFLLVRRLGEWSGKIVLSAWKLQVVCDVCAVCARAFLHNYCSSFVRQPQHADDDVPYSRWNNQTRKKETTPTNISRSQIFFYTKLACARNELIVYFREMRLFVIQYFFGSRETTRLSSSCIAFSWHIWCALSAAAESVCLLAFTVYPPSDKRLPLFRIFLRTKNDVACATLHKQR